jgi:Flp pilus assembly pilin Flp
MSDLMRFLEDQEGVTSTEYALLGTLIALAIFGSLVLLGGNVGDLYEVVSSKVSEALAGP